MRHYEFAIYLIALSIAVTSNVFAKNGLLLNDDRMDTAPDPKTSEIYWVTCIRNLTEKTQRYSVQWKGDKWKTARLKPGESKAIFRFSREDQHPPRLIVKWTNSETSRRTQSKRLTQLKSLKNNCKYGKQYVFRNDSNNLKLLDAERSNSEPRRTNAQYMITCLHNATDANIELRLRWGEQKPTRIILSSDEFRLVAQKIHRSRRPPKLVVRWSRQKSRKWAQTHLHQSKSKIRTCESGQQYSFIFDRGITWIAQTGLRDRAVR